MCVHIRDRAKSVKEGALRGRVEFRRREGERKKKMVERKGERQGEQRPKETQRDED